MKRTILWVVIVLLLAMSITGCAGKKGYKQEKNTGRLADDYPYVIRTASASWFLSKEDIELLGKDAYYDGLYAILDDSEPDFADAREALKGYIPDEIAPVDIYTDFCDKEPPETEEKGAYYNSSRNFIKLHEGWDVARASLLHEYVHYLTTHCADPSSSFGFWSEGAAEYISLFVCKNRLARSVNMGFDLSELNPDMVKQTWNETEDCLEPKLVYLGCAEMVTKGYAVGSTYFAVRNEFVTRTQEMQENPDAQDLTFYEAASMYAYLVETFGKDTVFQNWNLKTENMDTVYGKPFSGLYHDWVAWNEEQCKLSGITTP